MISKNRFFLIISLQFLIFQIYGQKADNQFDISVYGCMVDTFAVHKIDLNMEMQKIETLLIKEKIFESSSSSPCYTFFEKFAESGEMPNRIEAPEFEAVYNVSKNSNLFIQCFEKVRKSEIQSTKKSKHILFREKVDKLQKKKNIYINDLAKIIISVYKPSDFINPVYKNPFLISILLMVYKDVNYDPFKIPENTYLLKDSTSVTIRINNKNEIFYNNNLIDTANLYRQLKTYISVKKSANFVYFKVDRNTSYAVLFEVQNVIFNVYKELLNIESKNRFGKEYLSLNESEKKIVDKVYPFNFKASD